MKRLPEQPSPATAREVAIKVQYPGIAEVVEADMRDLMLLSPMLRQLGRPR